MRNNLYFGSKIKRKHQHLHASCENCSSINRSSSFAETIPHRTYKKCVRRFADKQALNQAVMSLSLHPLLFYGSIAQCYVRKLSIKQEKNIPTKQTMFGILKIRMIEEIKRPRTKFLKRFLYRFTYPGGGLGIPIRNASQFFTFYGLIDLFCHSASN